LTPRIREQARSHICQASFETRLFNAI